MQELIQAIVAGVTAFTATNIDDILILVLLFAQGNSQVNSQANSSEKELVPQLVRPQHIVAGQYLGFGVLILASLPGFLGGFMVPRPWLGWLGLVPVAIGLNQLRQQPTTETNIQTVNHQKISRWLPNFIHPQTYQVAAITVGNGGDNIGIYVPLFANSSLNQLLVILAVFLVMVALWCAIAYSLTRQPLVLKVLARYGQAIVPIVLIALGIYIFIESESYKL